MRRVAESQLSMLRSRDAYIAARAGNVMDDYRRVASEFDRTRRALKAVTGTLDAEKTLRMDLATQFAQWEGDRKAIDVKEKLELEGVVRELGGREVGLTAEVGKITAERTDIILELGKTREVDPVSTTLDADTSTLPADRTTTKQTGSGLGRTHIAKAGNSRVRGRANTPQGPCDRTRTSGTWKSD